MAVKLRLRRMGKKKQPIYKVVAADSRSPRDGKYIEAVGLYNPLKDPHIVDLKEERVNYWLDNGAKPTDTVKSLFKQKGIILKRELIKKGLSEDRIKEELESWAKLTEAKKSTVKRKSKSKAKSETNEESEKKLEATPEEKKPEKPVEENENSEKGTAEVKGAASDESSAKSEGSKSQD